MDKFLSNLNGGLPFVLDDLRFTDDGIREGLKNHLDAISAGALDSDGMVLFGCVRSIVGPNVNITAGAIYFRGEIFTVDAQTFTFDGAQTEYFEIKTSFDAAGLKTFQDASSQDTYQIRKAEVLQSLTPPSDPLLAVAPGTYKSRLTDLLLIDDRRIKGVQTATNPLALPFGVETTVITFTPSTTKNADPLNVDFQGTVSIAGGGGTFATMTVRIKKNAAVQREIVFGVENNGFGVPFFLKAIPNYAASDTITVTMTPGGSNNAEVQDGQLIFESQYAVTP